MAGIIIDINKIGFLLKIIELIIGYFLIALNFFFIIGTN